MLLKLYLMSLGAGVLMGVIYSLLEVRSPAPPVVALVGLLGMLAGEQIVPVGKQLLAGAELHLAWRHSKSSSHLFGMLPGRHADTAASSSASPESRS
jgi:XapX domain-containing protein